MLWIKFEILVALVCFYCIWFLQGMFKVEKKVKLVYFCFINISIVVFVCCRSCLRVHGRTRLWQPRWKATRCSSSSTLAAWTTAATSCAPPPREYNTEVVPVHACYTVRPSSPWVQHTDIVPVHTCYIVRPSSPWVPHRSSPCTCLLYGTPHLPVSTTQK